MPARIERAKVRKIVGPRSLVQLYSLINFPLDLVAVERTKCVEVLEGVINEFI